LILFSYQSCNLSCAHFNDEILDAKSSQVEVEVTGPQNVSTNQNIVILEAWPIRASAFLEA